jgi:glycosyltransferase involved in cell wall biosynthesis
MPGTTGSALPRIAVPGWRRFHRSPDADERLRSVVIFHTLHVGGPTITMLPRLRWLAERGELTVLFPRRGSIETRKAADAPAEGSAPAQYSTIGRVAVVDYGPMVFPRTPAALVRLLVNGARDSRLLRREIRSRRPDVVIVVTAVVPAAVIAARAEGIPVVAEITELPAPGGGRGSMLMPANLRHVGLDWLVRFTASRADRVTCPSQAVAGRLRDARSVTVAYPGISLPDPAGDRKDFRKRHGLGDADFCIAVIGNVSRSRGQDVAVAALSRLRGRIPDARCMIVGVPHPRVADVAFERELRAQVDRLGLQDAVIFTGFVERIEDAYAAADVVVNPVRSFESFGRVACEALLAGRPVVSSSVGAVPEVLRAGVDALLVPPDDPEALAEAVSSIASDDALRAALVASGAARVRERFSEGAGIERFVAALRSALTQAE